jgi:hypothetical protein
VGAGDHSFKYQNNDASWGETTVPVPQYATFSGGCSKQAPAPAPREEAPPPPRDEPRGGGGGGNQSGYSDEQLTLGAQYYLYLVYSGINIVMGSNIQPTQKVMDDFLRTAIPEAHRNKAWADVLVKMIDAFPAFMNEWTTAVQNGDEDTMYQNMRAAAQMLNTLDPKEFPYVQCDEGDKVDCLIIAKRRWYQQQQQQQRQRQQVEDAAYWDMMFQMEAMNHATNMMIINNI